MATESETVEQWLDAAKIPQSKRTPQRMPFWKPALPFCGKAAKITPVGVWWHIFC
jgi:hypothetical protein